MRKHCSQLVLMVIMSVVATALARAQDITVRSTQPFSAAAAFTGFFSLRVRSRDRRHARRLWLHRDQPPTAGRTGWCIVSGSILVA